MRTIAELIKAAKSLQAKADDNYIALGKVLAELKERKPKGITWPDFVKKHFGYGRERADELIRIGAGATTIEKSRERVRTAVKNSRKKNPVLRNTGSGDDNVIRPEFRKPEEGDCDYDDGDPDHVAADTPEMTRRQIFLNMAREWGIKRPTEVLDDAFFGKASPGEATDDLFVEVEQVIAAWNAIADKLRKLQGAATNGKIKVKA